MQQRLIELRIRQLLILAETSRCPRRKFGAMVLDPIRNAVIADGYNGGPRGQSGHLCAGTYCERDARQIPSGTQIEHGCHHAEMNALMNAAAAGAATRGAWLIVTGEPCLMCAKLIHHAGIIRVIYVAGGYAGGSEGVEYLKKHHVEIECADGPTDPRKSISADSG